jgi:CxxC-x17-CxxC domain-containing protein
VSYLTYADKPLTCRDCGNEFTFTAGEQEFFVQKGFTNDPGRCNECRAARKSQRGGTSYDGDRGYSSDRGNSGGGYGGGYSRGPREMFSAICSECGQTAQVPFQPRTDKPVYCSSCFEQKRSYR